jgi:hypothetical protein
MSEEQTTTKPKPPTFIDRRMSASELISKMHAYNVKITELAKQGVSTMHTGNMEGLLQNFSMLMAGNYGDQEKVEVPVDVLRNMGLFASVSMSRLVWERYKYERKLGRPVVEEKAEEPTKEQLVEVFADKVKDLFGEGAEVVLGEGFEESEESA